MPSAVSGSPSDTGRLRKYIWEIDSTAVNRHAKRDVTAPFSFEVFLNASDDGVIRLLSHYSGYNRDFDDFLVGGSESRCYTARGFISPPIAILGITRIALAQYIGGFSGTTSWAASPTISRIAMATCKPKTIGHRSKSPMPLHW